MSRTCIQRFNSMADFIAALPQGYRGRTKREAWYGGESYDDAIRNVEIGWTHIVPQAQALIDQIELSGMITRGQPLYVNDVAGNFPNVPAYLAGEPECMFRRGETAAAGELAPITVYIDVAVGCTVSPAQMVERGIACLALVMILSERRPVELFLYSGLGPNSGTTAQIPIIPLETRPMDMAALTYALASAGFYRRLCMGWSYQFGYNGGWPWGVNPQSQPKDGRVRAALGAELQDLVIFGAGNNEPMINNPLAWLHEQLKLHLPE